MLFHAFILLSLFTVFILTQVVNDVYFTSSIVLFQFASLSLIASSNYNIFVQWLLWGRVYMQQAYSRQNYRTLTQQRNR